MRRFSNDGPEKYDEVDLTTGDPARAMKQAEEVAECEISDN